MIGIIIFLIIVGIALGFAKPYMDATIFKMVLILIIILFVLYLLYFLGLFNTDLHSPFRR